MCAGVDLLSTLVSMKTSLRNARNGLFYEPSPAPPDANILLRRQIGLDRFVRPPDPVGELEISLMKIVNVASDKATGQE